MKHVGTTLGTLAVGGLLLAACGTSPATTSTTTTTSPPASSTTFFHSESANELVTHAESLLDHAGAVTFVGGEQAPQLTVNVTQYTSTTGGSEFTTGSAGEYDRLLIGSTLYVKGDTTFLTNNFEDATGVAAWANRWIEVPSTDPSYVDLSSGLNLTESVTEDFPYADFKKMGVSTFEGSKAYGIEGTVDPEAGSVGDVLLFFSLTKPYDPVGITLSGEVDGESIKGTIKIESIGVRSTLTAPAGATPISATSLG